MVVVAVGRGNVGGVIELLFHLTSSSLLSQAISSSELSQSPS